MSRLIEILRTNADPTDTIAALKDLGFRVHTKDIDDGWITALLVEEDQIRELRGLKCKTIIIESESQSTARAQIKSIIDDSLTIISEEIISKPKTKTKKEYNILPEKALSDLHNRIPKDAEILKENTSQESYRSIHVKALSEEKAMTIIKPKLDKYEQVKNIEIIKKGSKGLLFFGKTSNEYKATILKLASAEITYKISDKVIVQFEVGPTLLKTCITKAAS